MSHGPSLPDHNIRRRRQVPPRPAGSQKRQAKAKAELREMGLEPISGADRKPAVGTQSAGTHGVGVYRPGAIAFSLLGGGVYVPGS